MADLEREEVPEVDGLKLTGADDLHELAVHLSHGRVFGVAGRSATRRSSVGATIDDTHVTDICGPAVRATDARAIAEAPVAR